MKQQRRGKKEKKKKPSWTQQKKKKIQTEERHALGQVAGEVAEEVEKRTGEASGRGFELKELDYEKMRGEGGTPGSRKLG